MRELSGFPVILTETSAVSSNPEPSLAVLIQRQNDIIRLLPRIVGTDAIMGKCGCAEGIRIKLSVTTYFY